MQPHKLPIDLTRLGRKVYGGLKLGSVKPENRLPVSGTWLVSILLAIKDFCTRRNTRYAMIASRSTSLRSAEGTEIVGRALVE